MIANDVAFSVKKRKENVTIIYTLFLPLLFPTLQKISVDVTTDKIDLRLVSMLVFLLITLSM